MKGRKTRLTDYVELLKPGLCFFIGLSAVLGQVTADQKISGASAGLGGLVFILACGSAVLNNIQDREYDSNFIRTACRSLPRKKLPISHAVCLSILLIVFGLTGLAFFYNFLAFFFGSLAVFSYNGLYTPLKKYSLSAIIPGSLTGMLPPLIGWVGAGNGWMFKEILLIMGIFGLWQIPHFFIILLKTQHNIQGASDKKRYPCFTNQFSPPEIRLQVLIWTSLYSLAIILFLMTGPFNSPALSVFTGINAVAVFAVLTVILFQKQKTIHAFAAINLSMFLFMAAGIGDKCVL
ncbi:UbiA family prenyltransferase [Desulfobacter vibrioformis]|uniref:UbiA family prenyltransferase n=1 Tax=Desulfobacter vibrioformis TaxID=34031 RepID=UPI0005567B48|nr:UbiA family prenyltransferase [Desulfobacter vibrioformis]